ncbi:MAG: ABC transporter ATP-binding protein [Bacteroidota bacterium]|nr:ABC transporter ATP-binding protein [Candidatus Kapabacteria bacterium]MDW8219000.1 ABC transporter ATP-binding protein [Bacteroidota bacterium]
MLHNIHETIPCPFLLVENLSKSYREGDSQREVLRNISLQVQKGETVALVGKSGSGKSTLLNMLSGIDTPDTGTVVLNNTSIYRLSEHDRTMFRRRNIGFVFQFFHLIPTLTVEENIFLPLELNGLVDAAHTQEALELLQYVGLYERRTSFPDRLSGGEQQRIAIVRALVHRPMIVLADEPTGNLDEETGTTVLHLLVQLAKERGVTLIMATHSSDTAQMLQRIVRIHQGDVIEQHKR